MVIDQKGPTLMAEPTFTVAVFPFLQTSGPTTIGDVTFRSTTDVANLPAEQAEAVAEIAKMLFVHGNVRVKSATYAITSRVDLHWPSPIVDQLARIRAILAYVYAAPHEIFGNLFLTPEDISLALFTPDPVSVFLVRPERRTENLSPIHGPVPDKHHNVPGYRGLYNFLHYFWVERNSRLYGPMPHMRLSSQDLKVDLEYSLADNHYHHLLLNLIKNPSEPAALRIFSALHWFNAANEAAIDSDRALLNLAVAFESLLRLPASSKTERLVDAITLLLGRTDRLDDWAEQFYAARSSVAHEGRAREPYYYIPASKKTKEPEGLFGSLLLYGRQIFRLCLNTLLVGADLAAQADLQEKFVSNNERYQQICDLLKGDAGTAAERLANLQPILQTLRRYQFVASGRVSTGPLIIAVRYAALTLLSCGQILSGPLADALGRVKEGRREDGEFAQLDAIRELEEAFETIDIDDLSPEARVVRDLIDIAWMRLFEIYYWLEDHKRQADRG